MSNLEYYILDVETTGLNPSYHEITEISILRCKDRMQLSKKIKCFYPERANAVSLQITNKTFDDLSKGDNLFDVMNLCNKFLEEDNKTPEHRVIIAHNASFDRRFVHANWNKGKMKFPASLWMDTLAVSRAYVKKTNPASKNKSYNLDYCLDLFEIKKFAGAHSAKVDTRNTYLLHNKILEKNFDIISHIKSHPHENLQKEIIEPSDDDRKEFF